MVCPSSSVPAFDTSKPTSAPKASGNCYQACNLGLRVHRIKAPSRESRSAVAADQKALCTADISDTGLS